MTPESNQTRAVEYGRRFGNIVLRIERLPPLSAVAVYAIDRCIWDVEEIIRDESVIEADA